MKSVLFSIRPNYCQMILDGKKDVEIRKTRPKLNPPFKGYIYCTVGGDALALPHLNDPHYSIHRSFNGRIGGRKMSLSERDHSNYTYANGNVIGEFVCDWIKDFGFSPYNHGEYVGIENLLKRSCLRFEQMFDYIGEGYGFGHHISDLKIYETPVSITQFFKPGATPIYDLAEDVCQYCIDTDYGEHASFSTPNGPVMCEGRFCKSAYLEYLYEEFGLKRPPQSWCYVDDYAEELS